MTRKLNVWLVAIAIVLIFGFGGLLLGPALGLHGADRWVLGISLLVLGLVAAGAVLWFFLKRSAPRAQAAGDARTADIDTAIAAAETQLASARAGGKAALGRLPMVLVLGAEGSAKTTSVIRSGLEPELVAGGVHQGETVAPTKNVNVWYTQGTVLLEAAGGLTADASRFARLIHHAQPRRLGAVFGGGAQAPRMAVVCVSCEEFLKPGASESAIALARTLRARTAELSHTLGIRLPVYVMFTKADRIPYFAEYVQNLSADEARQVLGATLPADLGAAGLYTDRQTKQLTDAFQQLFVSLADKRLQFLARENAPERKPGAYEFPRELRKLAPLAVQFLVELGKPSQLQMSPFLRGFYFSGVRAVFVTDAVASTPVQVPAAARAAGAAGMAATGVFDPGRRVAAAAAAPAAVPTTRKVPQWTFLGRFFPDVVLADRAAMNATSGGARVDLLRRVALAGAAAVVLLFIVGLTLSYAGNRRLERDALNAARAVAAAPAAAPGAPPLDALQRLDSLRTQVQRLSAYEHDGPPLRLRLGLYAGGALYPAARHVYFAGFDKLLFADTRSAMTSTLTALPPAPRPTDDYGSTYALFKAYLITTTNPEKSTEDFLTPVLQAQWISARQPDSARALIAQRQFALYANELRFGNPYTLPADSALVAHTRSFLHQFAGTEPIYQAMLADAAKGGAPIQFNRQVPGSAGAVVDRYEVPAAFTKGGYAAMQRAFANADRFFQGEPWVLGAEPPSQLDRAKAIAELKSRYQADYIGAWRSYLQNAAIVRYGSVKDASSKLGQLAGNQSPLLSLLAIASQNTNMDSAGISAAMQPVHAIVPPTVTPDKLIGPAAQPYMTALANLQAALDQVAAAPPGGADAQIAAANQNAGQAKAETQKIAQQFRVTDAGITNAVQRLLADPVTSVEPFLRNYGAGQLNAKGGGFCAEAGGVLAKFPFDPSATTQASPAEVTAVFHPLTGSLWKFYNDALQNVLVKQGNDYVPKPGGTLNVSPAFLSFFNRAAAVSAAFFPQTAAEPHLTVNLQPVVFPGTGDLAVTIGGETVEYSRQARQHTFTWTASPSAEASIAVKQSGGRTMIASFHGPWALFQLMNAAASSQLSNNGYRLEWSAPNAGTAMRAGFDVNMGSLPMILRKGYFSGFRCTSRVVK
jgi:type VI secretion system protein ImpL